MKLADSSCENALNAVSALIKANDATDILTDSEKLFLQVSLHRIPNFPQNQEVRKTLELPLRVLPSSASTCFFIKNTDAKKDDENCIEVTKEMLKKQGIEGDMFITLDQLKKEYKGHELKRKLAQQFDVFFSDSRIARLALPHLGKAFFARRRVPFVIRMERQKKIKHEIEVALKSVQVILTSKGPNINIHFGHTLMTDDEKLQNLKALVGKLDELIPRGTKNIKALFIQGTSTKGVPLYRNSVVDDAVKETSGIELERQQMAKQMNELLADVKVKKPRAKKTDKKNKAKKVTDEKKPELGKRKTTTLAQRKAKRAKLSAA